MRVFFIIMIFLLLKSCKFPFFNSKATLTYVAMADQITEATVKKISRTTGLKFLGVGGGAIDCIRKLNLSFKCEREINLAQARELLIYCVEEYLDAINSNEAIRPYLIHYPFTPQDIEMEIYIYKNKSEKSSIRALSLVNEHQGYISYYIRDAATSRLEKTCQETYKEALRVVETSRGGLSPNSEPNETSQGASQPMQYNDLSN